MADSSGPLVTSMFAPGEKVISFFFLCKGMIIKMQNIPVKISFYVQESSWIYRKT